MKQILKNLFVGADADYEKVKHSDDWSVVRACKDGPGGHRDSLGYETRGAPKGPTYLSVQRGNRLALNLIDPDDPSLIPDEVVDKALQYIDEELGKGKKVLIACNAGQSRGPTLAFLFLYKSGKLPRETHKALRLFRQIYPDYDPATGLALYAKRKIQEFKAKRHG